MRIFKGLLHEDLASMIHRKLEESKVELFTTRLTLESDRGRERTLMKRIARLEQERAELQKTKVGE